MATYNEIASGGLTAESYYAGKSSVWSTSTLINVPAPDGTQEGDYLVAIMVSGSNSDSLGSSHFTDIQTADVGDYKQDAFARVVTGSEPASYTFTSTASGTMKNVSIFRFRNVDTTVAPDFYSVGSGESFPSSTLTASSIYIPPEEINFLWMIAEVDSGSELSVDTDEYDQIAGEYHATDSLYLLAAKQNQWGNFDVDISVTPTSPLPGHFQFTRFTLLKQSVSTVSPQYTTSPEVSGGVFANSRSPFVYNETASDGLGAAGTSSSIFSEIASGGTGAAGSADLAYTANVATNDGAEVAGEASLVKAFDQVASGGVGVGGAQQGIYDITPSGGLAVEQFYVSNSFAIDTSASTAIDAPSGIQEGDYLLALVWSDDSAEDIDSTDFTSLGLGDPFGTNYQNAYGRTVTDSEPASYTFTSTNASAKKTVSIFAFRGIEGHFGTLGTFNQLGGGTAGSPTDAIVYNGFTVPQNHISFVWFAVEDGSISLSTTSEDYQVVDNRNESGFSQIAGFQNNSGAKTLQVDVSNSSGGAYEFANIALLKKAGSYHENMIYNSSADPAGLGVGGDAGVSYAKAPYTPGSGDVGYTRVGGQDAVDQWITGEALVFGDRDPDATYYPGGFSAVTRAWIRFPSIDIPQGSIITSARLIFTPDTMTHGAESDNDEALGRIFVEQVDNPAQISSAANAISRRPNWNSSPVLWDDIPEFLSTGADVESPDISSLIQNQVDREGWDSGNALMLVVSRRLGSTEGLWNRVSVAGGPSLTIEWQHNVDAEGGLVAGGEFAQADIDAEGGAEAAGEAPPVGITNLIGDGGTTGGGDPTVEAYYNPDDSAGLEAGGDPEEYVSKDASGGAEAASEAEDEWTYNPTSEGGVESAGESPPTGITNLVAEGGLESGGDPDVLATYNPPTEDGAELSGEAEVVLAFVPTGGIEVAGETQEQMAFGPTPEDGILAGGTSGEALHYRNLKFTSSGGVDVEEFGANIGTPELKFRTGGTISVEGSAGQQFVFGTDRTILWRTRTFVRSDCTFLWNIGQLQQFFYRIVGQPRIDNECLPKEECCQRFIINVHAKTLTELCEKLSKRSFIGPIESVQRFGRPANINFGEDAPETPDDECNELIPIDICEIPACADFCVDFDLVQKIAFEATDQVAAFVYNSDGLGISAGGTAANVGFTKNVPDFPWVAEAAEDSIGGAADYISSGYGPIVGVDGEIVTGGSAIIVSSAYQYLGGQAPDSRLQSAFVAESVDNEGQLWSIPERALVQDGLTTQSDISYGKTSDLLVLRNFGFNVPSGVRITGIQVNVRRYSSTINVRDEEVYLMLGDEIVSDNLANANDWPLILTDRTYGSTGFDTSAPWRDVEEEPWDVDDINSEDFGFAISVSNKPTEQPTALAQIDHITVEVFWEVEEHQQVRTGGNSGVKSSAYHFQASGGVELESDNIYRLTGHFLNVGHQLSIQGSYGLHVAPVVNFGAQLVEKKPTGAVASGSAEVTPRVYTEHTRGGAVMRGTAGVTKAAISLIGARLGGSARVSPYNIEASGGMSGGGTAKVQPYEIIAEGGLSASGTQSERPAVGGSAVSRTGFVTESSEGGSVLSGSAVVSPWHDTVYTEMRVNGPNSKLFDTRQRGEMLSDVNIDQLIALARLGTVSSGGTGHGRIKFTGLLPNQRYSVRIKGKTSALTGAPNNIMTVRMGDNWLYINQQAGTEVEVEEVGAVTTDANGAVFLTFSAEDGVAGSGGVNDHVFLTSVLFDIDPAQVVYNVVGSGGLGAAGLIDLSEYIDVDYEATGEIEVAGDAGVKSSSFQWVSDGNAVLMLGSAGVSGFQNFEDTYEFGIQVLDWEVTFADDEEVGGLEPPLGDLKKCDCGNMGFVIQMSHNLARNNNFAQFLLKNNLTIPRVIDLLYNEVNDSWQSNLHYRGVSTDKPGTLEQWDLVFEMTCTDSSGGINIGNTIWRFAIQVNRRNLNTFEDSDTRLVVGVIPDILCRTGDLAMTITYDTQSDLASVTPNSAIYQNRLFDNIGLFQNRYWEENPNLLIDLSETEIEEPIRRLNIQSLIEPVS